MKVYVVFYILKHTVHHFNLWFPKRNLKKQKWIQIQIQILNKHRYFEINDLLSFDPSIRSSNIFSHFNPLQIFDGSLIKFNFLEGRTQNRFGKLTEQCSWLESHATRVNVLDQLTKYVGLKLFNDQSLMLLWGWLSQNEN